MKDQTPLLVKTGKGDNIQYNNKYIYSTLDPETSSIKKLEQIEIQENTLYFIPSPCLFYGFKNFLNRLPENSFALCIEISKDIMNISLPSFYNLKIKKNNFKYFRCDKNNSIYEILKNIPKNNLRRTSLISINGSYRIYKKEYDVFFNIIEQDIRNYWQNKITLIHMSEKWFKNIFMNLNSSSQFKKISELKTSKPILILGAGESLEKSIDFIKNNREHIFIIAVDTALPVLFNLNIKPDLALIVESQFLNLYDFYNHKNSDLAIAMDLCSYSKVPKLFTGDKYFFLSNFTESVFINQLEKKDIVSDLIPPGGSVGITACIIAEKLTDNTIFLCGLDFSYKLGKPHSNGAPTHILSLKNTNKFNGLGYFKESLERPIIKLKDKNNKECISDLVLFNFYNNLKSFIINKNRYIDISKTGLNLEIKRLDYDNINFENISNLKSQEKITSNNNINPDLFIKETIKKLKEIIDLGSEIIRGEKTLNSSPDIFKLILESDFIIKHFPDSDYYNNDITFLKRAVLSANNFHNFLKKRIE